MWLAWSLIGIGAVLILYGGIERARKRRLLQKIFSPTKESSLLLNEQERLSFLLQSSGVDAKEYRLVQFLSILTATLVALLPLFLRAHVWWYLLSFAIAVGIGYFTPRLFLMEQRKRRIEKIDRDLATLLDLLVIVLQSGGGLLNAIEVVLQEAHGVICEELLQEMRRFQTDIATLPAHIAYENLIKRTGSENIASVVSFMQISQESGIGLQSIFENQSEAIKEKELFEIEKKAATINIKMILVVFLFLLPAIGAFILLPMWSGALMPEAFAILKK